MLPYRFVAQHIPGPLNIVADAASRNPSTEEGRQLLASIAAVTAEDDSDNELDKDILELHVAMINALTSDDDVVVSWDRVKRAAVGDDTCMFLCDAISKGFPHKKSDAEECLRPYYKLKDDLYSLEGVPCIDGRMFIPKSLRRDVLSTLHSAHQGVAGMKATARGRFWWIGMNADIEQVRAQCRDCNEGAPSNVREPLILSPEPEYPWQKAVMDYFESAALKYLVIADRFTGWPELFRQNGKAMTLVKTCRNLFSQFGVPEELSFDGGPPFDSFEWKRFLIQWDIKTRLSSANYAQSNGRAELAVKSCKRMLYNNTDGHGHVDTMKMMKALLQYRNTPSATTGMSPAYMLFGRQLRDALPSIPISRDPTTMSYLEKYGKPSTVWSGIKTRREIAYAQKREDISSRYNVDKHHLAPLSVGDPVSIQNRSGSHPLRWDRTGIIVERLENRQYLVKSDGSGRVLRRTRTHLRKISSVTRRRAIPDTDNSTSDTAMKEALLIPGCLRDGTKVVEPIEPDALHEYSAGSTDNPSGVPELCNQSDTPNNDDTGARISAPSDPVVLRRSGRTRRPKTVLSPRMDGKRHDEVELTV